MNMPSDGSNKVTHTESLKAFLWDVLAEHHIFHGGKRGHYYSVCRVDCVHNVSGDVEKLMLFFLLLIICRYTLKPNDQILAEDKHKALLVSPTLARFP